MDMCNSRIALAIANTEYEESLWLIFMIDFDNLYNFKYKNKLYFQMMLQPKLSNGNTLKDSFYKERLIKSSANSMYNTFNRTLKA